MDILNWVYLIKNKFTRTTVENPATDLVVLGADVSYQKRGDKYQNYVMTVEDFANSLGITPGLSTFTASTGTTVSGATQVSSSVLIPADTIAPSGTVEFISKFYRVSGVTASITCQLYTNTTNTLLGATLLATSGGLSTGQQMSTLARTMNCVGGNIKTLAAASLFASDYTSQAESVITFDTTVDNYFFFVVSTTNPDTAVCQSYRITVY
jgi:hypothetical protein